MSLPPIKFRCSKCDYDGTAVRVWEHKLYALPNGARLPVKWTYGWCEECADVRLVEQLSLTEAQDELAEARQTLAGFSGEPVFRWGDLWNILFPFRWKTTKQAWEVARFEAQCAADDAQDRVAMIKGRQSGPKCLTCGSTQIQAGNPTGEGNAVWTGILHPDCGGRISSFVDFDGIRIFFKPSIRLFDTEGRQLPVTQADEILLLDSGFHGLDVLNARSRGCDIPAAILSTE